MDIIENIYYGNITPYENYTDPNKVIKCLCENEDALYETLTEKQKEYFKKFTDCQLEMSANTERQAFRQGFIMGARIVFEVMKKDKYFDGM